MNGWNFNQLEVIYVALCSHIEDLEWEREEWRKWGWEDAQSREQWEELCEDIEEARRVRDSVVCVQYDGIPF